MSATAGASTAAHGSAEHLPIRQHEGAVMSALRKGPVTILIGETGSGKTTQLPQILLDSDLVTARGAVAVTQPRRVAAISVARRVAFERGARVGGEVGYAVRFDECSSSATRLKYLTDGTLLREMLDDALLSRYEAVVLDEAHERSLHTDILFSLLKRLVAARSAPPEAASSAARRPLKLVVMSATLDSKALAHYFGDCELSVVPGRQYPVELIHSAEDHLKDYVSAAVSVAVDLHAEQPPGDILVFLTGQAEVEKAARQITDEVAEMPEGACAGLIVLPLYAALPLELQARVFTPAPQGCRRCIVATNVAETSITIDGIVYVVDSGMCKEKSFDAASGMERLDVQPISRVQATQRAGRAGRTAPGKCFRLYTQRYFDVEMPDTSTPEIQRVPLLGAVLQLKSLPESLGIDVLNFDFVDSPGRESLEEALKHLYLLDALTHDGKISELGRQMVSVPLEPQLARALLAALELGSLPQMLCVAAMLSVDNILQQEAPPIKRSPADESRIQEKKALLTELTGDGVGDHVFLLRLWEVLTDPSVKAHVMEVLRVNQRGLSFAQKVRGQLARVVEQRVWPAYIELHTHTRSAASAATVPTDGSRSKRKADEMLSDSNGYGTQGSIAAGNPRESSRGQDHVGRDRADGHREKASMQACPDTQWHHRMATTSQVTALRQALACGYASQLARRLPQHNGYRTLCAASSTVASLHSDCVQMEVKDGLLPPWLLYHELVKSARVSLRKVCVVEYAWIASVIEKLETVSTARLSTAGKASEQSDAPDKGKEASAHARFTENKQAHLQKVSDAKARALARRALKGRKG